MKIADLISLSFDRIKQRQIESLIIIITLALGTAVISLAFALLVGINRETTNVIKYSNENYIEVVFDKEERNENFPNPLGATLGLMYDLRENNSVIKRIYIDDMKYELLLEELPVNNQENILSIVLSTDDYFEVTKGLLPEDVRSKYILERGNFFTEEDIKEGNRVLVLGSSAAERIFPGEDPIGKTIAGIHSKPYKVIGVLQEIPSVNKVKLFNHNINNINQSAVAPITTSIENDDHDIKIEDDFYRSIKINSFKVIPEDITSIDKLYNELEIFLDQNYGKGYELQLPFTVNGNLEKEIKKYRMIGYFAAAAGIMIAAINILNLLLARMLRKEKDIGTFISLDLKKKDIFVVFIFEALILGLSGGILGYFAALASKNIFTTIIPEFLIKLDLQVFMVALAVSFLVSFVFGVYPSLAVFRIDLREIMQSE